MILAIRALRYCFFDNFYLVVIFFNPLRDNFSYDSAEMGSPNTDVLDHYDVRRAPSVGMCALALIIFFLVYLCLAERALAALARSRR